MAIPDNLDLINTNLPPVRLEHFLNALREDRCFQVPGTASLCAEAGSAQFIFEGNTYSLHEFVELVSSIHITAGDPLFVQMLINEHEAALEVVVKKRDYDAAKKINSKIESLKTLQNSAQPQTNPLPEKIQLTPKLVDWLNEDEGESQSS